MTVTHWNWKLEVQASTYPVEEWMPMRSPKGRLYRFVDRMDAELERDRLLRIQPHATIRVAPA